MGDEVFSMEIDLGPLAAELNNRADQVLPVAGEALYQFFEEVMAQAKDSFVPVDEGVLRGSGYVLPPVIEGDTVSVTGGFGGPAGAYARAQHERLDYHHTVGQAKYLEAPLQEALPQLSGKLQSAVMGVMSGAPESTRQPSAPGNWVTRLTKLINRIKQPLRVVAGVRNAARRFKR
jgi:hypothetical protein